MHIEPLEWRKVIYQVEVVDCDHPDYKARVGGFVAMASRPPAFILRGNQCAKYGLFEYGAADPEGGEGPSFRPFNLRPGQKCTSTPFGKAGFRLVDNNLRLVCRWRAHPTPRRKVRWTRGGRYVGPTVIAG